MRLPDFERILGQDSELPDWFKKIWEPVNRLLEYTREAFSGEISVQNCKIQMIQYRFRAPFTKTIFPKTKKGKVVAVYIAQIRKADFGTQGGGTSLDWYDDGDNIVIEGVYSVGAGEFIINFMCFYE